MGGYHISLEPTNTFLNQVAEVFNNLDQTDCGKISKQYFMDGLHEFALQHAQPEGEVVNVSIAKPLIGCQSSGDSNTGL